MDTSETMKRLLTLIIVFVVVVAVAIALFVMVAFVLKAAGDLTDADPMTLTAAAILVSSLILGGAILSKK